MTVSTMSYFSSIQLSGSKPALSKGSLLARDLGVELEGVLRMFGDSTCG